MKRLKKEWNQQSMETQFRLLKDLPAKFAATIHKYIYNCFEKKERRLCPI